MSSASSASSSEAFVTLSNGVKIPTVAMGLAFGNWTDASSFMGFLPEQAWSAIRVGWEAGYRHFDTAHVYGTETHLRDVLGPKFASNEISRKDIFITTKVAHPHFSILPESRCWNAREVADVGARVKSDFLSSLEKLGVGYVDLLLVHWPGVAAEKDGAFARQTRNTIWKVFQELYQRGLARAIGVSNFNELHLQQLWDDGCTVKPMVNQIELHPFCQQHELVAFCKKHNIVLEAYAPLASGCFNLLSEPTLVEIGRAVGRSTGQVVLRWLTQHGYVILPRSTNAKRASENLNLWDFQLTSAQMAAIDDLQKPGVPSKRTCPDMNEIL